MPSVAAGYRQPHPPLTPLPPRSLAGQPPADTQCKLPTYFTHKNTFPQDHLIPLLLVST
jgi:hypothetical protein